MVKEKWKAHRMACPEPECEGELELKYSERYDRHFYGCINWRQGCNGGIGAHRSGKPLGIPADTKTKKRRMAAHRAFDRLWKGSEPLMSRGRAYKWLGAQMGKKEVHMGEMDAEECDRVVALMHEHYPELFRKLDKVTND